MQLFGSISEVPGTESWQWLRAPTANRRFATLELLALTECNWNFSPIDRFLRRPESRFCRFKCPHRAAVTAETLENLVFRKGDVSTLLTHKATISSRAQQHEVVNQNTVWATGLFDHGWLLWGGWPKSSLILRPNC
jgi:hypothetical protein